MPSKRSITFDVVGTLISYQAVYDAIEERLGDKLREHHLNSTALGYTLMEVGEREYTYLSLTSKYVPFYKIFAGIFYRVLAMSGVPEPRSFVTQEDFDYIQKAYMKLAPRPGAAECLEILRAGGFEVYCLTAGDKLRVGGYFAQAGIDMPNLFSCDESKIGKPDPKAYMPLYEKLSKEGQAWFAAAHQWDVTAAKAIGFRGAYCTIYEFEALDFFGEMDVTADTLPEMARRVVAEADKIDAQ